MNQDLHQVQIAVWILRSVGRKFNQCFHSGRNNIQGSQSESAPDGTTRYGTHVKGGDDTEIVASAFENAEQVYQASVLTILTLLELRLITREGDWKREMTAPL